MKHGLLFSVSFFYSPWPHTYHPLRVPVNYSLLVSSRHLAWEQDILGVRLAFGQVERCQVRPFLLWPGAEGVEKTAWTPVSVTGSHLGLAHAEGRRCWVAVTILLFHLFVAAASEVSSESTKGNKTKG